MTMSWKMDSASLFDLHLLPLGLTEFILLTSGFWTSQWVRKTVRLRKERAWSHKTWVQIPALPLIGGALDKPLNPSKPVFSLVKLRINDVSFREKGQD